MCNMHNKDMVNLIIVTKVLKICSVCHALIFPIEMWKIRDKIKKIENLTIIVRLFTNGDDVGG